MNDMFESRSPQRPEEIVGRFRLMTSRDVVVAVQRGRNAQRDWSALGASDRADALGACAVSLQAHADELVELGVREVGKPRSEMVVELARAVRIVKYFAQASLDPSGDTLPLGGEALMLTVRRPHGVVGLVTPWNFPVAIPIWKAAPALAYGNAAVIKPSPDAAATATRLVEILEPCLPDGLLQIVHGMADVGAALVDQVDALSFTGSTRVGREVACAAAGRGIPVQAEMGGKNASVILPDADYLAAARVVAAAAMGYAGQKCTATSRVIVVGDCAGFEEALVSEVQKLNVGDPELDSTDIGPVISRTARERAVEATRAAVAAGGKCFAGGSAMKRDGWFVEPTVIGNVEPDSRLAQEEIFAPVCALIAARDDDEALSIANNVEYGLAGAVFTADLNRALRFVNELRVGLVKVNGMTTGAEIYAPFGGTKASSLGPREQGKAARDFYTWTQTATIGLSQR